MDNGNITALVLLDISAAFDTVRHSTLIDRLKDFGVTARALKWFTSYLSGRSQYISIDGVILDATPLTHGVPQGSVGGPLLFSIYTQPLGKLIGTHNVGYHSYADDIQLFISFPPSDHNLISVIKRLEECVCDINSWMTNNNLKLNGGKSEFMLLGSKVMLNKIRAYPITICGVNISPKEKCRNLGVIMDSHMTINDHISRTHLSICSLSASQPIPHPHILNPKGNRIPRALFDIFSFGLLQFYLHKPSRLPTRTSPTTAELGGQTCSTH